MQIFCPTAAIVAEKRDRRVAAALRGQRDQSIAPPGDKLDLGDFLAERGADASPERCRTLAIAINGLLDGLWLEGCLAGELFGESELVEIALTSIETMLGLRLRATETTL